MKNRLFSIIISLVFLSVSFQVQANSDENQLLSKESVIEKTQSKSKSIMKDHVLVIATPEIQAALINLKGDEIGAVSIWQAEGGVLLRVTASGLSKGMHGMHFHASAACIASEGFISAGKHIVQNTGDPHGYLHKKGPHAGNLPNLIVGEDGKADAEFYNPMLNIYGRGADGEKVHLLDYDGAALIIHENRDDHITQPIGNSGKRVACATLRKNKIK